eukprot:6930644-Ditylum_brightwellii.AAC.1
MLVRSGQNFRWCTNDCHLCGMWCPRTNCMNRADYKKKMEETKSASGKNKLKVSKGFHVALLALMLEDTYLIIDD